MVEVEHNLRMLAAQFLGILNGTLGQILQQGLVGIVAGTFGHLKNHGRLEVGRSFDDSLQLLHVVEVESGHCIAAVDGALEHLLGVNQA